MTDLEQWIKLFLAVSAAIGAIGGVVGLLVKRFPPRSTGLASEVATLRAEIAGVRTTAQAEVVAARTDAAAQVAGVRADLRLLTDYVHDIREDFARETGKAPRDWPEGLRL